MISLADGRRSIIITVFSTASGIGKTVVSTNFAAGLAREGYSTCLIDLDLQFGDVCNYLHLQPTFTIADALSAMQQSPQNFNANKFLTTYQYDGVTFSVLPSPLTLDSSYVDEPQVMELVEGMDDFDFIIIDTKAEFSELNMSMMDISTIVTFLCVADFVPTIKNLKNGYEAILRFGYDSNKIRPVLNRSDSQTLIDPKDVEVILGKDFYYSLSNDFRSTQKSIESGCPLILTDSSSKFKKDLQGLVDSYSYRNTKPQVEKVEEPPKKSGVFGWVKNVLGI